MNDQWLSIVEYARTFAISDMTVRRRIKTGRIHAVLREGKYFIPVNVDSDGRPTRQRDRAGTGPDVQPSMAVPAQSWSVNGTATLPRGHNSQSGAAMMRPSANNGLVSPQHSPIPNSIQRQIEGARSVAVDGGQLLSFCQDTLRRLGDTERSIRSETEARQQALSSDLYAKNLEMQGLKQQIEDMQVLLNMLEGRR